MLAKNGTVPPPDGNMVTLTTSGTVIGYQGYAGPNTLSAIKMSNAQDPLDKKYYTYLTNATYTKYQILALLEDGSTKVASADTNSNTNLAQNRVPDSSALIDTAFAGYDTRYPVTKGSRLGVLLGTVTGSVNQPIQELYNSASFTGVDVGTTATGYTAIFSNTPTDRISGTGIAMAQLATSLAPTMSTSFTKTLGGSGFSNPQGLYVDNFGYTYVTGRYDNTTANANGAKDFSGNILPGSPASLGDS